MITLNTQLRAQDAMALEPVCVRCSTTLLELARVFEETLISWAAVVDRNRALTGTVSKSALIRRYSQWAANIPPDDLFEVILARGRVNEIRTDLPIPQPTILVEEFMTRDPVTVAGGTPLTDVANLLLDSRIRRIIVVDEQRIPIGIISRLNLLSAFTQQDPDQFHRHNSNRNTHHPYHYPWSL